LVKNCKNWQKCALFDPVFCTPLRKLFEVKNSYFVSRISYVARENSATDFTATKTPSHEEEFATEDTGKKSKVKNQKAKLQIKIQKL
jgi:hypothetical protein